MNVTTDVPILTAYFSHSGSCLHMNEGTISLPNPPENTLWQMKKQRMTCGQAEAQWEKIFWQNDIAMNTQIERPKVLKQPDHLNRVSFDGYECDSFDRVVKIVQFFGRSGREYLSNQALVTYYYDNKDLCSFQIYTNLKHTLAEIEQFESSLNATARERRAFMGWYLAGNSMFENPFGFTGREKTVDYFRAYRITYLFDVLHEEDGVYERYENCFVRENEYEFLDDISDNMFYKMYEKDIVDDPDDDLDDDPDYDPDDDPDDELFYKIFYDPDFEPTDDTNKILDWIEKQFPILIF